VLGSPDNGVPVLRTRSARLRRVLMPLFILIVVGIVALLLAGRGQQTQITGAGSTLAQPLIERSAAAFRDGTSRSARSAASCGWPTPRSISR